MAVVVSGKPMTRTVAHLSHCFDALRQHVMCAADDTLLQVFGEGKIGIDQKKQCKDWDQLRKFATKYPSHYSDVDPSLGLPRWGIDDKGDDGLPVGGLV